MGNGGVVAASHNHRDARALGNRSKSGGITTYPLGADVDQCPPARGAETLDLSNSQRDIVQSPDCRDSRSSALPPTPGSRASRVRCQGANRMVPSAGHSSEEPSPPGDAHGEG